MVCHILSKVNEAMGRLSRAYLDCRAPTSPKMNSIGLVVDRRVTRRLVGRSLEWEKTLGKELASYPESRLEVYPALYSHTALSSLRKAKVDLHPWFGCE